MIRKFQWQLISAMRQYNFSSILDTKISKEEWMQKEKEWSAIAVQKNKEQMEYLTSQLNEHEIKRVKILVEACSGLNIFEFQSFFSRLNEYTYKSMGVELVELNSEWPIMKSTDFQTWPPQSKEDYDKAISALWDGRTMDDFKKLFGGIGAGGSPQKQQSVQQETQETKKPEETVAKVTEKSNYDIELTAFDPAKKINVIKEVRQLFNLGLKDSKDLVEKAPCTISKQVKAADAEGIKQKLEALGCQIKLL